MTPNEIAPIVSRLGSMSFFPGDVDTRIAVAECFAQMGATAEQASWVVARALALYSQWPGIHELRSVFCSRWRPADGLDVCSDVYLDGIPAQSDSAPRLQLTGSTQRQITGDIWGKEFPPDATDALHAAIERQKAINRAPLPDAAEIERLMREQAEAARGEAAVLELEHILGLR